MFKSVCYNNLEKGGVVVMAMIIAGKLLGCAAVLCGAAWLGIALGIHR